MAHNIESHVLKAIAKAWHWRRKLESGAVATMSDIAMAEDVTTAYVGRILKLAYRAPNVLENCLLSAWPPLFRSSICLSWPRFRGRSRENWFFTSGSQFMRDMPKELTRPVGTRRCQV